MEYKLSPSILSADFCNLEEGIRQTEENGAVYLHFDVKLFPLTVLRTLISIPAWHPSLRE